MTKHFKSFDELTYTDDFMFKKVMTDPRTLPAVKWIIEMATNRKVEKIVKSEYEKTIETTGKGVRLDAVFEEDDRVYDIEMQNYNDDLRQRAEYYFSSIDIDTMEQENRDYSKIKHKYLIYILTKDFLKMNEPILHEEVRIVEYLELPTRGYRTVVYINTTAPTTDANLKAFFAFVQENAATNAMTNLLKESTMRVKKSKENRKTFMDEINARRLEREEGKKEGLQQGLRQGKKEGKKEGLVEGKAIGVTDATNQIALNMLKEGESIDKISKFTGLTVEQIQKLKG